MSPSEKVAAAAAAAAGAPGGAGAAGARQLELWPAMRLQRLGSIAVVQPVWGGEVAGPSLTVDLETGTLALAEHPKASVGRGLAAAGAWAASGGSWQVL